MEGPETEPDLGSIDKVDALDELRRLSPLLESTVDFPKMSLFNLGMCVCVCVNGRPTGRGHMSHFCVTLRWMVYLVGNPVCETMGIDVTRRAESIGDIPSP